MTARFCKPSYHMIITYLLPLGHIFATLIASKRLLLQNVSATKTNQIRYEKQASIRALLSTNLKFCKQEILLGPTLMHVFCVTRSLQLHLTSFWPHITLSYWLQTKHRNFLVLTAKIFKFEFIILELNWGKIFKF